MCLSQGDISVDSVKDLTAQSSHMTTWVTWLSKHALDTSINGSTGQFFACLSIKHATGECPWLIVKCLIYTSTSVKFSFVPLCSGSPKFLLAKFSSWFNGKETLAWQLTLHGNKKPCFLVLTLFTVCVELICLLSIYGIKSTMYTLFNVPSPVLWHCH